VQVVLGVNATTKSPRQPVECSSFTQSHWIVQSRPAVFRHCALEDDPVFVLYQPELAARDLQFQISDFRFEIGASIRPFDWLARDLQFQISDLKLELDFCKTRDERAKFAHSR
jgi:hypothetical protein